MKESTELAERDDILIFIDYVFFPLFHVNRPNDGSLARTIENLAAIIKLAVVHGTV